MSVTALDAKGEAAAEPAKSKKKLIIIGVVVALLAAVGYWHFGMAKSGKPAAPVAGTVFPLDSIQINLADGHYLKLTLAIQGTKKAKELDGSKALDAAINLFTGQTVAKLSDDTYRQQQKEKLAAQIEKLYPDEVMGIYYTEFVMQ